MSLQRNSNHSIHSPNSTPLLTTHDHTLTEFHLLSIPMEALQVSLQIQQGVNKEFSSKHTFPPCTITRVKKIIDERKRSRLMRITSKQHKRLTNCLLHNMSRFRVLRVCFDTRLGSVCFSLASKISAENEVSTHPSTHKPSNLPLNYPLPCPKLVARTIAG